MRELASVPYEGRLPDTAGGALALAFAEERLESLGLDPAGDAGGFRQAFSYSQWGLTAPPALDIAGDTLESAVDFSVFHYSGAGEVTDEIVFAGYGMTVPPYDPTAYPRCPLPSTGYDDFAGLDVAGKIVLVLRHGPRDDSTVPDTCPADPACASPSCLWNFSTRRRTRRCGAAAVLVVQRRRGPGGSEARRWTRRP